MRRNAPAILALLISITSCRSSWPDTLSRPKGPLATSVDSLAARGTPLKCNGSGSFTSRQAPQAGPLLVCAGHLADTTISIAVDSVGTVISIHREWSVDESAADLALQPIAKRLDGALGSSWNCKPFPEVRYWKGAGYYVSAALRLQDVPGLPARLSLGQFIADTSGVLEGSRCGS